MAHAPEEVAQMAAIASALVLNIGTLTHDLIESMKLAIGSANKKRIPVVLDVCGAGATKFRDEKITELLKCGHIDIIKGNASEIARVAGVDVKTKGVDATHVEQDLADIGRKLAKKRNCLSIITGKTDIVADEKQVVRVNNGCDMMSHVVGTGCMAASVIGTFAAVAEAHLVEAVVSGLCCYEIAAEIAATKAKGPGTFKEQLFDCVFQIDGKTVDSKQKIEK